MGRNKPLKDLAWGLVSRGVAVLRFDKVTFAHRDEVRQARSFTLADEYVPHATAAAELQPDQAAASTPGIDALVGQARRVDSDELSASTPSSGLPLGVPAPYWLDLGSYNPVAVAVSLGCPNLLLQGGRDHQSAVDDDLVRWQAGLAGHEDLEVRVHPADNRLFFPGSGPSSPAEHEPAQHVDEAVVADIAAWLAAHAAPPRGRAS